MVFTSSFQRLPNTGSNTVSFRCRDLTYNQGRGCRASSGDPVEVRINGVDYFLYGGNSGCESDYRQCQTMRVGSGFKDYKTGAPFRFLCEAMGYSLQRSLGDTNPIALRNGRSAAVFQVNPFAYGTSTWTKAGTFVECVP
jgi:hypothetical protein